MACFCVWGWFLGLFLLLPPQKRPDYTETEWQDVNRVTDKIHTLVMTEIGMLPTIDLYFIVIVIITLGSIIALFRTWHSRRK